MATKVLPLTTRTIRQVNRVNPEQVDLFRQHHEVIETSIRMVCRRQRLDDDEAEEFTSEAHLKLLKDNQAALRKYSGKAGIKQYLVGVLTNLFLSLREKAWGKWRPSVEAQRLGPEALLLERLVIRDKLPFTEAAEMMRTNHGVALTDPELEAFLVRFPKRHGRNTVSEKALVNLPAQDPSAEETLNQRESMPLRMRVSQTLHGELTRLSSEERVMLRMRFHDGFSVASIARMLCKDQRQLYRSFDRITSRLRDALEKAGIVGREVVELLDTGAFLLEIEFREEIFPASMS